MKNLKLSWQIVSLIIFSASINYVFAQKKKIINKETAHISIQMEDAKFGDTITLVTYDQVYTRESAELGQKHNKYIATKSKKGGFEFDIPLNKKVHYFSIYKEKVTRNITPEPLVCMLREYLIEPNDKINISVRWDSTYHASDHLTNNITPEIEFHPNLKYKKQYHFEFTGKQARKYKLRYDLDKFLISQYSPIKTDSNGRLMENPAVTEGLKIIEKYNAGISKHLLEVIKLDFVSQVELSQLQLLSGYKKYDLIMQYITRRNNNFNDEVKLDTRVYPFLVLACYDEIYPNKIGAKNLTTGAYYYIKNNFRPGEWRDKLLFLYVTGRSHRLVSEVLDDAKITVHNKLYQNLMSPISSVQGNIAYNFELTNTQGKTVKLSDFRGKVIFIDFWFTGCSACKQYFKDIVSKVEDKMHDNDNIVFLTIAIDTKFDNWVQSVNQNEYTSMKAVNLFTNGQGQFHPVINQYKVSGYPRPILIDRNGHIFTDKDADLRSNGIQGLENKINDVLKL